jgi:antitoxin HicB
MARSRRIRVIYNRKVAEGLVVDKKRTFAVVLEPDEDGGFTVRVPAIPEIVTYAKDEREALAMAEDAIRLVVADCAARGEPIPEGEPPRIREVTVTLAA